jgi:hypothetical protein
MREDRVEGTGTSLVAKRCRCMGIYRLVTVTPKLDSGARCRQSERNLCWEEVDGFQGAPFLLRQGPIAFCNCILQYKFRTVFGATCGVREPVTSAFNTVKLQTLKQPKKDANMDINRTSGKRVSASWRDFVTAQSNRAVIRKPWKSLAAVAFGLLLSVQGLTQAQYSFTPIDVPGATGTQANGNSTNRIVGSLPGSSGDSEVTSINAKGEIWDFILIPTGNTAFSGSRLSEGRKKHQVAPRDVLLKLPLPRARLVRMPRAFRAAPTVERLALLPPAASTLPLTCLAAPSDAGNCSRVTRLPRGGL